MKYLLKRFLFYICFCILLVNLSFSQTDNLQWVKQAGGSDKDFSKNVTTDKNGNVLITGIFLSSSVTFGNTILTNYYSGIYSAIFIVKYDINGNVLWARKAGGIGEVDSRSIATDSNDNILITGSFASSSITFGTITLTNIGGYDIFLVKYDSNGNVLWAKSAGGTDNDEATSVTTDPSGNSIITGYFKSSYIKFGVDSLINDTISTDDIFLTKYDVSGNVLWTKSAGGIYSDEGRSVVTDKKGNIILTGAFSGTFDSFLNPNVTTTLQLI